MSYLLRINQILDGLNYKKYWDVDMPVPFTWEGSVGPSWGSKITFDYKDNADMTLEEFYTCKTS